MKVVDFVRSAQLGREIGAMPTMCFRNAYRALAHVPGVRYVEAFVTLEITSVPVAHRWNESAPVASSPRMRTVRSRVGCTVRSSPSHARQQVAVATVRVDVP